MIDTTAPKGMTEKEGLELITFYVNALWNGGKFYSLRETMEPEDVISEVFIKFKRHNNFEKYDPKITSKKYHVMRGVSTTMIDLSRKIRNKNYSLDQTDENGFSIADTVSDPRPSVENEAGYEMTVQEILEKLPDTEWGPDFNSPLTGLSKFSYRTLFLHMVAGWRTTEISEVFGVSNRRINLVSKEIKTVAALCLNVTE